MSGRVRFTETMTGTGVVPAGPAPAADWNGDPAVFHRTAAAAQPTETDQVALVLAGLVIEIDPAVGPDDGLVGWVTGGQVSVGDRRLAVVGGGFVALGRTPGTPGRSLRYRLALVDGAGRAHRLYGLKEVAPGAPWPWRRWTQTTRMRALLVGDGRVLLVGQVRIGLLALLRQVASFRGHPWAVGVFVARFLGRLAG